MILVSCHALVSDADAERGVIAQRLEALWQIRPASLRDVAAEISEATGRHVTAAYLGQLRQGTRYRAAEGLPEPPDPPEGN